MTAPEHDDGFLRRWSRRKVRARTGQAPDDAAPPDTPAAAPADAGAAAAPGQTPDEPPPLTLDDVRALTPESDFAPFVARQVAPDVKNAALKKLFADPHYNVMDGLDTYIDDYSRMEALPAPMLRRLASAQALAMLESPDDAPDGRAAVPPQTQVPSDPPTATAQSADAPVPDPAADAEPGRESDSAAAAPGQAAARRQG
ncbi:DUF3306 domain-containing protein [Bordetella petrii]|uniref:DUF3306 domain-containing protein n=1 Tax=Bordetella petrii TaxID=94624 RepID=UPI001A9656CB|nr:DUF3306 domain-containing protein [Bordetella petrii]MBO1112251.1 DUF3306 domain-containing protein [Bordetella petrii]